MNRGLLWAALLVLGTGGAACFWQGEDESEPRFQSEVFVTGVEQPVAMAILPDQRLLVTEKNSGDVRLIEESGRLVPEPVTHFDVASEGEWGLLGIALHPEYEANRLVYVYYMEPTEDGRARPVIARFELDGASGGEPVAIIDDLPFTARGQSQPEIDLFTNNHVGGNIHFGPDGLLYVGIGDFGVYEQTAPDPDELTGKILRFTADGEPSADDGLAAGTDPRVFALGLRNPFDFDFDEEGRIFAIENGPDACDEINIVLAGQDYGWPSPRVAAESCERRDGEAAIAYLSREGSEAWESDSTVGPSSLLYLAEGFGGLEGPGLVICEVNTARLRYLPLEDDRVDMDAARTLADNCFTDAVDFDGDSLLYTSFGAIHRISVID